MNNQSICGVWLPQPPKIRTRDYHMFLIGASLQDLGLSRSANCGRNLGQCFTSWERRNAGMEECALGTTPRVIVPWDYAS